MYKTNKQQRQCTYDVTLRHVRANSVVAVEGNKYYTIWVCICSLSYPACNEHAPYCHLWTTPLYNIFPTLSRKRYDLKKKKLLDPKCVFWFSLRLSETFLILRRNERDVTKNVYWSSCTCIVYVYSVQCTVYSIQCTVYSVQYTVYSIQCTMPVILVRF
jgi:hypothetical protein